MGGLISKVSVIVKADYETDGSFYRTTADTMLLPAVGGAPAAALSRLPRRGAPGSEFKKVQITTGVLAGSDWNIITTTTQPPTTNHTAEHVLARL